MHPWNRQHRRTVGDTLGRKSSLEDLLFVRWREPWSPRTLLGEFATRGESRVRSVAKKADAAPNAPLLKRVIRWPFRLEVARGKRSILRDSVPWADIQRVQLPTISEMIVRQRPQTGGAGPLRDVESVRLSDADRGLVRRWLQERRERLRTQGDAGE